MRFRTKLFLAWALTVLIPLLAIAWPLTRALRDSFEHATVSNFTGTSQSLAGQQAQRFSQMRQAGAMVMSIPELRAMIAESNIEFSSVDQKSLQDRLDFLSGLLDVRFMCVLNSRGILLAQNKESPWQSLADLQNYAISSPQSQAMVRSVFSRESVLTAQMGHEGLWVYNGGIYQVVGMPLFFGEPGSADASPQIDGALIMAVPLSDAIARDLAQSHDCQVSFLADGRAMASSLVVERRSELDRAYARAPWQPNAPFNLRLGNENYRSSLIPLSDQASKSQVGAMLIQSSTAAAEGTERRVLEGLAATVLLAFVATLAASYFLSGAIVSPVRTLVQGSRKVAGGDLETQLPVRRRDELGQLTVAFNEMVVGLRRQRQLQALVEESQAASQAKSRFLANMSHEIRTPLHGVIGMSELLLRTELSQRQRRYVGLVKSSAELLTKLINDVLDFSKAEAGKLELETLDFDLRELIRDVVELMGQRALSKKLALLTNFPETVPAIVRGDPTRLRQVLLNLISNALKFTETGSITLHVSCAPAGGHTLFKFEVQDTGIGIPKHRMDRLFQSFSQVDASTTRRFGGTGLGLAICKQLAELMGGQIGLESTEGVGSTFWFTALMQCQREEDNTASAKVPQVCKIPYFKNKNIRILLVEDQEINCIVASELLTEAGLTHDIVHDGKTAVDAVINGNYHLVLMDCQMPGMDGLEATRHIRQHQRQSPSARRIPIIALTANTSNSDRDRCIAAGMDGFCRKPFTTQELYEVISSSLADFHTPSQNEQAQPDPQNAAPPFELQTILQRCSGKPALATVILDKFHNQASQAVAQIASLVAAGNAEEVIRLSHSIKGTAAILGAKPLSSAAARLEDLGRARTLELGQAALDNLRAELDKCVNHIRVVKSSLALSLVPASSPAEPEKPLNRETSSVRDPDLPSKNLESGDGYPDR